MNWIAFLIILTLVQTRFYQFSTRDMIRSVSYYIGTVLVSLLSAQQIRIFFSEENLNWWTGVVAIFFAFVIGEFLSMFFREEKRRIKKQIQEIPSFLSFTAIFITLGWISMGSFDSLLRVSFQILSISFMSWMVSVIFSGIRERLLLLFVPKMWEGVPILLISAALLFISFSGFILKVF